MQKRFVPRACALALICTTWLVAETVPPVVTGTPEAAATKNDAEAFESVPAKSKWDVTATVRGSVGWRNNVTVSPFHPIDRAFARGEVELFVLRPLGEHFDFVSFLNADLLRYVSPPPDVPGEDQYLAHVEGRWHPTQYLRTALKALGFMQTTYIDPSLTEGSQQTPLRVRVRGGFATLTPRLSLPGGFTIEPSLQLKRIAYTGYHGDYTASRPGVRLEWKRHDWLALSAAVYEHVRHYRELTASPTPRPNLYNPRLSLHQREGELKATSSFKAAGEWTVAVTVGRLENRDRATGYYDYDQDRANLEVSWQRAAWHVTVTGDAKRLDYLTQKVGFGLASARPARITDVYEVSARIERELGAQWSVFAEERWERNRSNATDDIDRRIKPFDYRTNTALVGVQRSF